MESNDQEEIKLQYYSFWNHGATGGKLHQMSESFAYITSSEANLERYFFNSSLHLLLNMYPDKFKGIKGGVKSAATELGKKRLTELKENLTTIISTNPANYDYSLGEVYSKASNHKTSFDEEEWKSVSCLTQRSSLEAQTTTRDTEEETEMK